MSAIEKVMGMTLTPWMKIALLGVALLLIGAIAFMLTGIIPHAKRKTKKNLAAFNKRGERVSKSDAAINGAFSTLSTKLARFIHMKPVDRASTEKALAATGSSKTPEEYRAFCYLGGGIFVVVGLFILLLGYITKQSLFYIIGVGGVVLGLVYVFILRRQIFKEQREIISSIDAELPRFVSFLNASFPNHQGSVLALLERYTAKDPLFDEALSRTIVDAKTSNFTSAMMRWEERTSSERLQRVVKGLINANEGDDVRIYFEMLERDFNAFEVTLLKRSLKTIPERMRLPKMLLYSAVAITLFFPIIMQVVESFQMFFAE